MQTPEEAERALGEVRSRQILSLKTPSIGEIVSGLMARRGYGQVEAAEQLQNTWQEAAGRLGKKTRCGAVKRGVLEVHAANSAVLQELTFQKRKILKQLQASSAGKRIRDVRFRVGPID